VVNEISDSVVTGRRGISAEYNANDTELANIRSPRLKLMLASAQNRRAG
jgi:hypothetical protein